MNKIILECALKKHWKDSTPVKVLSVEEAPALGKNFNYLSTVNRLSLKVVLGNGRVAKKSLITKVPIGSESHTEFDAIYIFQTEIKIYKILLQLEYLMEEFEDTEDILWCKMIHYTLGRDDCSIVLEDLKADGYYLIEREIFYDLEHTLLAVHSLGRYHGMCKTLEERGIMSPRDHKNWYLFDSEKIQEWMYWDFMAMLRSVRKSWDPSWKAVIEKINLTKKELQEKLKKHSELDETKFNVMNHGDCHKNNILFKYNWEKRPISLKFVDFQIVHYGSPCIDLTYMLYLAVKPSVRRDNFDLILKTYHNALVNTLDKYQYKGNKPNLDQIIEGMEKYSFLGYMQTLTWYPNILKSERLNELRDYLKIEATDGLDGYSDEIYEGLEDDIGPDLKAYVKKFYSGCE